MSATSRKTVKAILGAIVAGLAAAAAPHAQSPAPARFPTPTFSKDVAPILFARCATCHRPEGEAPFPLLTYNDARQHASQIAQLTHLRRMPPWKPEPGFGDFEGVRRLSDTEIATLESWASAGAPEGDRADLPQLPRREGTWPLGPPDLIVQLPDYTLKAEGVDSFRNFVVPIPGSGTRYVRGLQFAPGSAAVHHANIRVDPTQASRRLDDADPEPGYEGIILNSAEYPDGYFLGWTPGQIVPLAPKGLAWTLTAGSDLVVQLHMRPTGKPERIHPVIALYFTDDVPTEHPTMLRMGRQNIDIAAGNESYRSVDTYTLPVDAQVQAIQPHSHYRAQSVKAWAVLPDHTTRWLINIPRWDFAWQDAYRYQAPFWLPGGSTIFTEFQFDNSAKNPGNPESPPKEALWGFRSSDEMADVWIQVLTRNDAERRYLAGDFRIKADLEDIAGYETRIRVEPQYAALHNDVGVLYLEVGMADGAISHFETVTRLQPQSAVARFNLGTALDAAGRRQDAARLYLEAINLDKTYAPAHVNLGTLLLTSGQLSAAEDEYRLAVQYDPRNPDAQNDLGKALWLSGRTPDAILRYVEALMIRPAFALAQANLALALATMHEKSN